MRRVNFDLDVVRAFVTGIELGSFAKVAVRLGRSTSAISAQLKKLEGQVGAPILHRQGCNLALTPAGETMLGYGRRLLDLNDEAASAVRNLELDGIVRLGVQEDLGESFLPRVLGRFARVHPGVRIEARVMRNADLLGQVSSGRLDIALAWSQDGDGGRAEPVACLPMRWIGPRDGSGEVLAATDPVSLVLFDPLCLFRTTALAALDAAGRSWRIAMTGSSLAALWAASAAGLGVTLRTELGLPGGVSPPPQADGLPTDLPSVYLMLHEGVDGLSPAAECLAGIVRTAAQEQGSPDRPGQ